MKAFLFTDSFELGQSAPSLLNAGKRVGCES